MGICVVSCKSCKNNDNQPDEPQETPQISVCDFDFVLECEKDSVKYLYGSDKEMEYFTYYENYGTLMQTSKILVNDLDNIPLDDDIKWIGEDKFVSTLNGEELTWDCSFDEHSWDGIVQNQKGEKVSFSACAGFVDFNALKKELKEGTYKNKSKNKNPAILYGLVKLAVGTCIVIYEICNECMQEKMKECAKKPGYQYIPGMCCGDCVKIDNNN